MAVDTLDELRALLGTLDPREPFPPDAMRAVRGKSGRRQRVALPARLGVRHPKLLAAIKAMEENLEEPLTRGELADMASLSTRQLERLFRKYMNRSPARYYLELRLNKSRLLLLQTPMPVIDVALACGFVSASHFSKCYRDFFGKTPRQERSGTVDPADLGFDHAPNYEEEAA